MLLFAQSWANRRISEKKKANISPTQLVNTNILPENTEPAIYQWELKIPKISVSVPVVPNVDGANQKAYDQALNGGVAHFKGTALPDSGSNIFIFGHSSSVLGTGKYDKVFASLNKLANGDEVSLLFNGKEYRYTVFEKKTIAANDTSVLAPTQKEQLTLMTCWPVGTADKRLVIKASPK